LNIGGVVDTTVWYADVHKKKLMNDICTDMHPTPTKKKFLRRQHFLSGIADTGEG
jgi:hypothetical protein